MMLLWLTLGSRVTVRTLKVKSRVVVQVPSIYWQKITCSSQNTKRQYVAPAPLQLCILILHSYRLWYQGDIKQPCSKKVPKEYNREEIWMELLKRNADVIDDIPFQPEEHGFVLSSVEHKDCYILTKCYCTNS